ncbi:MAG: hypothetical protein K2H57_10730 [Duncaniella sp.]|nr:hypothetical protein [Duncaniella sp.]
MDNQIKTGGVQDILFRLLYLCGHIIECASIYLIFRHFRYEDNPTAQNWRGDFTHLHQKYNRRFTVDSHMDFYPICIENGQIRSTKRTALDGRYIVFGRSLPGEKSSDYYSIQSHNFKNYIKNIIHTQLPQEVPYLRQFCPEDDEYSEAINLIDTWNTDLRYYYEGRQSGHYNRDSHISTSNVNVANVGLVLKMCERIVNLLPSGRQL